MDAVFTIGQFCQMAQQRLALNAIVCRAFSSLLQNIFNDWVQNLSQDNQRVSEFVLPKLEELPSLIELNSFGGHGLGGQEGVNKFVCRVKSR